MAVARRTYKSYCDLMSSPRWLNACNAGARPQRLLWSGSESSATKTLAAPLTVITMSERSLEAFAESGEIGEFDARGRRGL